MIQVLSDDGPKLFEAIQRDVELNRIKDWELDEQGDYTYANAPWKNLAWMRVRKTTSGLRINIIGNQQGDMSDETYAVYHSRFVEMLVLYFDKFFDSALVTALGSESDLV